MKPSFTPLTYCSIISIQEHRLILMQALIRIRSVFSHQRNQNSGDLLIKEIMTVEGEKRNN